MALKSFIASLALLSFGVTAPAWASSLETRHQPTGAAAFSGVYFDVNAGYANRDWQNFTNAIFSTSSAENVSGNRGTFAAGLDLGYQLTQRLALEAGYFDIANVDAVNSSDQSYHNSTQFLYGAMKLYFAIYPKAYFFFKAGGGYLSDKTTGTALSSSGDLTASPGSTSYSKHGDALLGAGAYYQVASNWSVNLQFLYIPGYDHSPSRYFTSPSISLYTFGIGYKF